MDDDMASYYIIKLCSPILEEGVDFTINDNIKCLTPLKKKVLNEHMMAMLLHVYTLIYPTLSIPPISQFIYQSSRAFLAGEVLGSTCRSRENNVVICAFWPTNAVSDFPRTVALPLSIGRIQYFFKHKLKTAESSTFKEHIFAYVYWYKKHREYNWFGSSAIICTLEYECDSPYSLIPIQRISSVCLYGKMKITFPNNVTETILVATPTHNKHCYY